MSAVQVFVSIHVFMVMHAVGTVTQSINQTSMLLLCIYYKLHHLQTYQRTNKSMNLKKTTAFELEWLCDVSFRLAQVFSLPFMRERWWNPKQKRKKTITSCLLKLFITASFSHRLIMMVVLYYSNFFQLCRPLLQYLCNLKKWKNYNNSRINFVVHILHRSFQACLWWFHFS